MKNRKINLAKFKAAIIALCICAVTTGALLAQTTPITPTIPNNIFYGLTTAAIGFNTASIGYLASYPIVASAYYDGSTGKIWVLDKNIPSLVTTTLNGTPAGVPDLMIGNVTASSSICSSCSTSQDYILAVAYLNTSYNIEIDYYKVHDNGVHPITITYLSDDIPVTGLSSTSTVHIDGIANYLSFGGSVYNFAFTWDDPTSTDVYVEGWDLNADTSLSAAGVQVNTGTHMTNPDVAAVQTHIGGVVHLAAYVTYLDQNNELLCGEVDLTTSSALTPVVLDPNTTPYTISNPRIDAIDNVSSNSASNANYEVVAQVYDGSTNSTHTYDNVNTTFIPTQSINISSFYTVSAYDYFYPTVSVGEDATSGYFYNVFQYLDWNLSTVNTEAMIMEPLDYTNTATLAGGDCYWVNGMTMLGIPQRTNGQSGNYQSSTCSAPNDYTQPVFYAWQSYNGTSYMINYKFSSVSPYAFRKSAPEAVGESSSLWQLFPNPAADVLTLQNPGAANEQSGYVISDITGRIAINGQINGCTGTVNIAMLAPGTYVLKIINDGDEQSPLLFVKN